jgi:hypothetical protein
VLRFVPAQHAEPAEGPPVISPSDLASFSGQTDQQPSQPLQGESATCGEYKTDNAQGNRSRELAQRDVGSTPTSHKNGISKPRTAKRHPAPPNPATRQSPQNLAGGVEHDRGQGKAQAGDENDLARFEDVDRNLISAMGHGACRSHN